MSMVVRRTWLGKLEKQLGTVLTLGRTALCYRDPSLGAKKKEFLIPHGGRGWRIGSACQRGPFCSRSHYSYECHVFVVESQMSDRPAEPGSDAGRLHKKNIGLGAFWNLLLV